MDLSKVTTSFTHLYFSLWRYRPLVLQMAKREIAGRYRGSFLGLLWSFVNPVLMLAVYTFVFSIVFQARWRNDGGDRFEFALVLFAGLIVFNLFSECVTRAPGLILANANYVKKVIFPLEILPWVSLCSALFHAAVNLAVLMIFLVVVGNGVPATVLLLPLVILPLFLLIMGVSWLLASIGVFIRDVGQFVGMLMTVLMFMSPIFYPVSALPESVRGWLFLNPLTFIIEQARDVAIWGKLPDWEGLALYTLLATGVAWAGLVWFQKTRKGFADVL
ncbi:MAG: ABC transporter permease [Rhodocyclaceae bacterium]|nr:MAG: ABC transporter permease [Rhodocyclaceae bacterium]